MILFLLWSWTSPGIVLVSATAPDAPNNTTSYTLTIPASTAADDVLLLWATNKTTTAPNDPTDDDAGGNTWASVTGGTSGAIYGKTWWKRATAGTASKTITHTGFTDSCAPVLHVWRGCLTTSTPWQIGTLEGNAPGDETIAGFTPNQSDSAIVLGIFVDLIFGTTSGACTDPGALASAGEVGSNGGSDCAVSTWYGLQPTAAATGNFTWSQTDTGTIGLALALKPAGTIVGGFVFAGAFAGPFVGPQGWA